MGRTDAKSFTPQVGEEKVKTTPGETLRAKGWRPHSPVFCFPGIYGTRLEVWKGQQDWRGRTIWLSLELMGLQPAAYLQMKEIVDRSKHKARHAKGAFSATLQAMKDVFHAAKGDEEELEEDDEGIDYNDETLSQQQNDKGRTRALRRSHSRTLPRRFVATLRSILLSFPSSLFCLPSSSILSCSQQVAYTS